MLISLSGCNPLEAKEVAPIDLKTWLSSLETPQENPNAPTFSVALENGEICKDYDYDLSIAEAIKKLDYTDYQKKITKKGESAFQYTIHKRLERFDACFIYIYEDGTLTTSAFGGGWGAPKEQLFTYKIEEEAAKKIIDLARDTYNEIKTTKKHEIEDVYGEVGIESFFTMMEQSEEVPTCTCIEVTPTGHIEDEDRTILNDIKGFEFTQIESLPAYINGREITYYVTEDIKLIIHQNYLDNTYPCASLEYKYEGKYKLSPGYTSYWSLHYEINTTKVSELINKLKGKYSQE